MAVDSAGNIYIADYDNYRIRKVASTGIISTMAGNGTAGYSGDGGPATSAELGAPTGVAFDTPATSTLQIAVMTHSQGGRPPASSPRWQETARSGIPATADLLPALTFFTLGVAVDTAGNIYIADTDMAGSAK